jgi:MFS family permease
LSALGPIIGGFLPSWHWVYYFLLIITGLTWLMVMFILRETFPPAILRKRAVKLRKETGDDSYKTEQEIHKRTVGEIVKIAVGKPLVMLATEGIIICFSVSGSNASS